MIPVENILRFQIVQDSITDVEVNLQISKSANNKRILDFVKEEMQFIFGTGVDVKLSNDFQMGLGGKCNPIIQNIKSI